MCDCDAAIMGLYLLPNLSLPSPAPPAAESCVGLSHPLRLYLLLRSCKTAGEVVELVKVWFELDRSRLFEQGLVWATFTGDKQIVVGPFTCPTKALDEVRSGSCNGAWGILP